MKQREIGTYPVSESLLADFLFDLGTRLHHSYEKKNYMLYNQLKIKLWLSPVIVCNKMYSSNTHLTLLYKSKKARSSMWDFFRQVKSLHRQKRSMHSFTVVF